MPSIIDPIHGHIAITELEQLIINTPEMARLRRIQQLGLADLAFPGANHTRFEHSIGTLFIADKIAKALGLKNEEIEKVRIAALLHDIGHCAFSHVVESVLKRNPSYQPVINGKNFHSHEMFTKHIISNLFSKPEINAYIKEPKSYFEEIAHIATGDVDAIAKPYLAQIIANDIDADRIDFLLRDSYHTGVELGLVDVDQIVGSLTLHNERIILGGSKSYDEDMALTAAESMLIARAHHYSAIIHNPKTQGARVMLLNALENSLANYEKSGDVKAITARFFTSYIDSDLLNFIETHGSESAKKLISNLRKGHICNAIARFTHKSLNPKTRMALSTIARNGVAKKMFEEELSRRFVKLYGSKVLVDLDVASGIPKSTRIKLGDAEGFLYDESALANGLVRAISRQISLCVFSGNEDNSKLSRASHDFLLGIESLSPSLLRFIRNDNYLPIEGLLLVFYSAHKLFSEESGGRIKMPRLRNIAKIYFLVQELGKDEKLKNLFDYKFHNRYGFAYSDRLFEDIQLLVAMGMVDEDLRYFEKKGRWQQRYEYVLTGDGLDYAELIAPSYQNELKIIENYLSINKHSIPRDVVSIAARRYKRDFKAA